MAATSAYTMISWERKDADMALIRPWLLCCQHGTCPAKRNTGKEITRKDIPAEAKETCTNIDKFTG